MIVWTDVLEELTRRDLRLDDEARAELEAFAVRLALDSVGVSHGSRRDLALLIVELEAQLGALRARVAELAGIRPEFPPRPPNGDGLPRYGIRHNGPDQPLAVPMADGYWTPWHLATYRGPARRCDLGKALEGDFFEHEAGCDVCRDGVD